METKKQIEDYNKLMQNIHIQQKEDILMKLNKYKQNLKVLNNYIYSYNTKIGYINHLKKEVTKIQFKVLYKGKIITTSPTSSKHINYVASELNYKIIN